MSDSMTINRASGLGKLQKAMPFIICGLASLFYVYEFFLRIVPSAITHELMRDFSMNASGLGLMSAMFFYSYSLMQLPAGLLLDRFGSRILMTLSMAICTISALAFGSTHSVAILALSRFMVGAASSFAFIGALLLAGRWFPPRYFALITGLIQLMGCLGAIFGETPVTIVAERIGWRPAMHWSALFGLVITVLFWLILRDYPPNKAPSEAQTAVNESTSEQAHNEWSRLRTILKHPQTWFIGISGFAAWAPIATIASLWGIPFLIAKYHATATVAAAGISVMWVGVALASPLVGWWSNHIHSRRVPLIIGSIMALVASLGVIYLPNPPWWLMYSCLFFFGAAASAQAVTFGLVQDTHAPSVAATAVGFNNMAVVFGGVTLQPLIGFVLHLCWTGGTIHGTPIYTVLNYQKAFIFVPLCALLGLLNVLFFVKETHCKSQY